MKRTPLVSLKLPKKNIYRILYFLPILLSVIGLFFVFEASSVRAFSENGDSFRYLKLQTIWIGLGIASMIFFSLFDYKKLYYIAFPFLGIILLLLVAVLIPGIGSQAGGARRWIDLGLFSLQPTEFAKMATIIYLSSWFVHRERKRFFSFFTLLGLMMVLVVLQPDMGTALILFCMSIMIYYLAGVELHYLVLFVPLSMVAFVGLVKVSPYRFKRILAFFNPQLDPQGITYHINQILISLTNGGLFGQGFGASRQKYLFLPEAHTDSIFAIIGEEVGFIGSLCLIAAFGILVYNIYKIASGTSDRFGFLLAGGIFALFSLQIVINLCGMVNLLPLTGVPLPFISYGGSNMLTSYMLVGIVINIARRNKVKMV